MSFVKPARTLVVSKLPNSTIARLSIVFAAIFVWLLICSSINAQLSNPKNLTLRDGRTARVKVILEAQGQLHPRATNDDSANSPSLPMKAIANLTYDEVAVPTTDSITRAARYYHEAQAQLSVSSRPIESRLRENLRQIFCDGSEQETQLYSCTGFLTRNELELLTVPGNSALIDQLLPPDTAKEGQRWPHSDALLARLLKLDAVTANDISSSTEKIEDSTVRMLIAGKVVGSVDGVITELDINGKYNFDRKANCITWLAMTINEDRAVGPTTPGFKVEARLRVAIKPIEDDHFVAQTIEKEVVGPRSGLTLLEFKPQDSTLTMLHGRRWHVISESPKHAILRMVDDGQTVAQCNVRALPVQEKAKTVTLASFQQSVVKSLTSANSQVITADESINPAGLKVMRVQLSGSVSNATVQWIYHLAVNDDGRGVSYVFTMSADQAEKFAAADIEMTSSLRFSDTNSDEPRLVELTENSEIQR